MAIQVLQIIMYKYKKYKDLLFNNVFEDFFKQLVYMIFDLTSQIYHT